MAGKTSASYYLIEEGTVCLNDPSTTKSAAVTATSKAESATAGDTAAARRIWAVESSIRDTAGAASTRAATASRTTVAVATASRAVVATGSAAHRVTAGKAHSGATRKAMAGSRAMRCRAAPIRA